MNKTIWALAFVVLCSGFVFAMDNATIDGTATQSKYDNTNAGVSVTTEGGNVTAMNLSSTQSTERWAGFYGNVSGYLVLAENGHTDYMYRWTYDSGSGGEVCTTTAPNPTWGPTNLAIAVAATIDSIWGFGAVADNATETYDTTTTFVIGGQTLAGTDAINVQSSSNFVSGVIDLVSGAADAKDELAFCVNISSSGLNYNGTSANYEIMAPTNAAAGQYETYYFFVELI